MSVKYFIHNSFQTRSTIVWDKNKTAIIFDPGFENNVERDEIFSFISENGLDIQAILLTHAHFDHIFGIKETADTFGVNIYMHRGDLPILEANPQMCINFGLKIPELPKEEQIIFIKDGDKVRFGELCLEVLETPGHTPGGVCYYENNEKILISGDTLFAGSIGRSDLPLGDYDKLMEGIFSKLLILDGDTVIYPGHGPTSSIAKERATNPFLMPFNEPFESDGL